MFEDLSVLFHTNVIDSISIIDNSVHDIIKSRFGKAKRMEIGAIETFFVTSENKTSIHKENILNQILKAQNQLRKGFFSSFKESGYYDKWQNKQIDWIYGSY